MLNFANPLCKHCSINHAFEVEVDTYSELGALSKERRKIIFHKDEPIFTEGSKPSGVFCLKRGKIKIHKTGAHKKEQILRFAREGQLLGSRALIRNEYFTSSATAIEMSVLCFIPKQEFLFTLKNDLALKSYVLDNLSNNLRIAEDKITQLSISSVERRLAIIILRMVEVYGFSEDGRTVAIELTREELANLVGAANETTIRLLSNFRQRKLIALNGRELTILKSVALAEMAIASG